MAHLAAQETRNRPDERFASKLAITRRLYKQGYQKETIVNLFRLIDWVMTLPEDLELQFGEEVQHYEEDTNMQYVTSIERHGIKKGIEQGLEQGIEQGQEKMRKPLLDSLKLVLELKFNGH